MVINCIRLDELPAEQDYNRKLIIQYSESLRKSPPTKSQIEQVSILFDDFGFNHVVIPHFDTYAELDNWKRNKLEKLLYKGEWLMNIEILLL